MTRIAGLVASEADDGFIVAGRGYAGQRDVPAWTATDARHGAGAATRGPPRAVDRRRFAM